MLRNPYRPPQSPLETAAAPSKQAGFPFQFVARFVIGGLLCAVGLISMIWLVDKWAWFNDQAILDANMAPWHFFVPYAAMMATGLLLLLRSRFVFVAFAVYCVAFEWRTVRAFGWHQPTLSVLAFGLQLAMLSFLLSLAAKRRLR